MTEPEFVIAPDGTRLARRHWTSVDQERAAVLLIHGAGEHSGRWEHVGAGLADRGYTVVAPDLRGHGESGGRRAHVDAWDDFLDDIEHHLGSLPNREVPVVLYGHSTGALMALTYVLDDRPRPDLLVLSAPLLHSELAPLKQRLARLLGPILPFVRLSPELGEEHLARDPEVGRAYLADPLVETRWTLKLGSEMLRGMQRAEALPGRMPLPTLVLHGAEDRVADPAATEPLTRVAGVERVLFDGFRHEIHNEEGGTAVLDTVTAWIERQLDQSA